MNIKIGVACIIVDTINKKILTAKRLKGRGKGLWAFAGGGIERGETIAQAAERETLEETNLTVVVNNPDNPVLWTNELINYKSHIISFFVGAQCHYINDYKNNEPDKHSEWSWFSLEELEDLYNKNELDSSWISYEKICENKDRLYL